MEGVIVVVVIVAIALTFLMLSNFGKNPSRKTKEMLDRELAAHDRLIATTDSGSSKYQSRVEARQKVAEELARRRSMNPSAEATKRDSPSVDNIRAVVEAGYDEGWRKAKAEGKSDKKALETALAAGLLNRVVGIEGWSAISPELLQALVMESMPFKFAASADEARDAVIEYAVWRETPAEAKVELVRRAVTAMAEDMRSSGQDDFLASLRSSPFEWSKLLP